MADQMLGQNVKYSVKGTILTLEIDMSKRLGPSKSQKTTMVASTNGNATVGDVRVGLNVYVPKA